MNSSNSSNATDTSNTSDVTKLRAHLLKQESLLHDACGAALPPADHAILQTADQAVEKWQAAAGRIDYASDSHEWHQGISPRLLPMLASAFSLKHKAQYAELAKAIYLRVMDAEPWQEGWVPKKIQPLVVAHRLGNTECPGWFGALPVFLTSDLFDDAFVQTLIANATAQLNHLKANMFPGRNIRLTQADTLLTQSIRLGILPDAKSWQTQGVLVLNDGFHRLIAPDGASREATAWYHAIMMHMGMRLWRLKQAMPKLGLTISAQKVAPMFDYTLACIEPDGRSTRIGDTVGKVTPDGTLASFINLRKKCLAELDCDVSMPSPVQVFGDINQAMIRSDWSDAADYLTFEATTRYGFHWHPSRNSLQLCIQGQRVLADPGRMAYLDTPHRKYAVSTRGHSTINLNGMVQADTPSSLDHQQTKHAQFLQGDYAGGYWPLQNSSHGQGLFGKHQRNILWLTGRFILVIDHIAHTQMDDAKPSVESMWHFAPGQVDIDPVGRIASASHGNARLDLHALLCPPTTVMTCTQGQLEPFPLGWAANDVTDKPEPAPSVMLRIPRQDHWRLDMATLLVPACDNQSPAVVAQSESHDASEQPFAHLSVTWADGSRDRFWWTRDLQAGLDEVAVKSSNKGASQPSGFVTDASLLHEHCDEQGQLKRLTLVNGTFARSLDGSWSTPVVDRPCMMEWDVV